METPVGTGVLKIYCRLGIAITTANGSQNITQGTLGLLIKNIPWVA